MSGNVLPTPSMHEMVDRRPSNPEPVGNDGLRFAGLIAATNGSNERFGQDGGSIVFAASARLGMHPRPIGTAASYSLGDSPCPVMITGNGPAPALSCHIASVHDSIAEKQMVRPDASWSVAMVQDEETIRDWCNVPPPNPTMCERPPVAKRKLAVSLPASGCGPNPTRSQVRHVRGARSVLVDLAPKAVRDTLAFSHRRASSYTLRFRGQGRSGATNTLAVRSFYHKMLSDYAGKAA